MPERSSTYFELDDISPLDPAWLGWLRDCGFPEQQVCPNGWVARDVYRNTVSAKVLLWHPDDDVNAESGKRYPRSFAYRDECRTDVEMGVLTIQLDRTPPPFPEPEFTREEREDSARRSLEALWRKLATVGDLTDDDTTGVRDHQHAINTLSRLLDSIDAQRRYRNEPLQVGLTYGRGLMDGD